jgi:hypothetical protein
VLLGCDARFVVAIVVTTVDVFLARLDALTRLQQIIVLAHAYLLSGHRIFTASSPTRNPGGRAFGA